MSRASLTTLTAALLTTVAAVLIVPTASASMPAVAPLSTPSPSTSGCAAANFVCLYDGVGAASAVNTNTAPATLYTGSNCTGLSRMVAGNSWDRALSSPRAASSSIEACPLRRVY